MSKRGKLSIFEGYGIELEYMIVDAATLDVLPVSDELIKRASGRYTNDVESDGMGWSNEFVLHVIELRNSEPVPAIDGLDERFAAEVARINGILADMGGMLLPTAMHPWMDPRTETRLWPHRYSRIYNTYHRIFDCRNHGWANVQSSQVNVSFNGDGDFARLHGAVRFLLPLLPALAASSPVVDGRVTGTMDNRLVHYRGNQRIVPSISGEVIPEPVYTGAEYRERVLERMYVEVAPYDPEGILRHEWLNSRGAIPRFDRSAIEIRLLDVQECPTSDMAIAELVVAALKAVAAERWEGLESVLAWEGGRLGAVLDRTVRDGDEAVIDDGAYLSALGLKVSKARASEVWRHLAVEGLTGEFFTTKRGAALETILTRGVLARRIIKALGHDPGRERLREVYGELSRCLARGTVFTGQ